MKTFRMVVMLALCVTMLCGCAEIPVPDTIIDVPIAEETPEPLQNNQNVSSEERERAPRDSIIGDWVFWGSKVWGVEDDITNKPIPDEDLNIDRQCEPAFRITGGDATNEYELLLDDVESLILSYSPSSCEYTVVDDHLSAEEQQAWGCFLMMDIDTIYRCDEQGVTVYKRAKEGKFVGDFDDYLSHEDAQSDSEGSTWGAPEDEEPYAYNEADDPVPYIIRQMVSSYCARYLLPNLELGSEIKVEGLYFDMSSVRMGERGETEIPFIVVIRIKSPNTTGMSVAAYFALYPDSNNYHVDFFTSTEYGSYAEDYTPYITQLKSGWGI